MAESGWGRLNAGQTFGILAVDVDRALAFADMNRYEGILMQHLREKSWGTSARRKRRGEPWPDAQPYRPDIPAYAETLEIPSQRLYTAKSRLVKARMLVETAEGLVINKNAHQWLALDSKGNPSGPRLTPAMLTEAARAWDCDGSPIRAPEFNAGGQNRNTKVLQNAGVDATRKCCDEQHESVAITTQKCCSNNTKVLYPLIRNGRELDPTGLYPTGLEAAPPHAGDAGDEPFAIPDNGPLQGPPGRGSREADELAAWCDAMHLGNSPDAGSYGQLARELCDHHAPDDIRLFLECQVIRWRKRPGIRLATKVLGDWSKLGAPERRYLDAMTPAMPPVTAGESRPMTAADRRQAELTAAINQMEFD